MVKPGGGGDVWTRANVFSNVSSVLIQLPSLEIWKSTLEFTRGKSRSSVTCALMRATSDTIWKFTCGLTLGRDRSRANPARAPFGGSMTSRGTSKLSTCKVEQLKQACRLFYCVKSLELDSVPIVKLDLNKEEGAYIRTLRYLRFKICIETATSQDKLTAFTQFQQCRVIATAL